MSSVNRIKTGDKIQFLQTRHFICHIEGFSKTASKAVFRLVRLIATLANGLNLHIFFLKCSPGPRKLLCFIVREVQNGMQASCASQLQHSGSKFDATLLAESNKKDF